MTTPSPLRLLPSVDRVKQLPALAEDLAAVPDSLATAAIRTAIEGLRTELQGEGADALPVEGGKLHPDLVAARVRAALTALLSPSLVPVINAPGVVIHTNLGRAPIGPKVWEHMAAVATGYSNLEYDLDAGMRGSRHQHFEAVIGRLTGAEACVVVNNNAAAVLLVLTALARGREVVVSRGELIEIGGSFRLPDIMAQGGAILREVGTTNRTWLRDYEAAVNENTGLLMKAHRSNFVVEGFVHGVSRRELTDLAAASGVPFYEDLGSGLMADLTGAGIDPHHQVARVIADGVDLVSFSGDKMLGGPQAGVILGRKSHVERLKRHPLTRALRPDKVTLAGLEAVALTYLRGTEREEIPVVAMLSESQETTRARADALLALLSDLAAAELSVVACRARVGGGAEPERTLPSFAVRVLPGALSETELERRLRASSPPVLARVEEGAVLLDLRTVPDSALPVVAETLRSALRAA